MSKITNILEKIEDFKARTKAMREANPDCIEVQWQLNQVSFDDFQLVERTYSVKRNESEGRLFLNMCGYFFDGCGITIWSVPLKITTTITATEFLTSRINPNS